MHLGDTWVAPLVEHLALDVSSGHDLQVLILSSMLSSTLDVELNMELKIRTWRS